MSHKQRLECADWIFCIPLIPDLQSYFLPINLNNLKRKVALLVQDNFGLNRLICCFQLILFYFEAHLITIFLFVLGKCLDQRRFPGLRLPHHEQLLNTRHLNSRYIFNYFITIILYNVNNPYIIPLIQINLQIRNNTRNNRKMIELFD